MDGTRFPIPIGSVAVPTGSTTGAVEDMAQYAGQGCELVGSVQPAAVILESIIAEAEATLIRLAAMHRTSGLRGITRRRSHRTGDPNLPLDRAGITHMRGIP